MRQCVRCRSWSLYINEAGECENRVWCDKAYGVRESVARMVEQGKGAVRAMDDPAAYAPQQV